MFPPYEDRWLLKATAELCYSQHHGSGLHFTRACIAAMDLDEIEFYLEWLEERRTAEAATIRKANR